MDQKQRDLWASVLNQAWKNAEPIQQISSQLGPELKPQFTRADAYAIQEQQMKARAAEGEKQTGWKMGLTSEAKRRQMNLDSPLYGFLTDKMQVSDGGSFSLKGKIHPKIEPEVAFFIRDELKAPVTRDQVLKACSGVCAALEILDSRYQQFKYFSMEDVISDNSSSSHFILGPWREDFAALDLKNLKMQMSADGQMVQSGISSDISGDPAQSVVELCDLLAERGQTLKPGSIVLAGAATAAIELKPGLEVSLKVEQLPSLSVKVVS